MGSEDSTVNNDVARIVSIHAHTWGTTVECSQAHKPSYVSIHAPTCGATIVFNQLYLFQLFQSTLPHGERPVIPALATFAKSFNPRSHMGSDLPQLLHSASHLTVSIHAPTWGATCKVTKDLPNRRCFNPRSHMGSDVRLAMTRKIRLGFNPRSHMGSDRTCQRQSVTL